MWRIIVRRIIIAFSFLAISNPAFTQNTDSNIRQKQKPDHYFTPQESKIEGIGVIADLKACYLLLPDHNTYFFLVEIKLINNTDTLFESVTYSCTTSINIVHDSRKA